MSGKLSDSGIYQYFTWEVPKFFDLPSNDDYFLQSTEFCFAGDSYCLRMYPNGKQDDTEYIDILLVGLPSSVSEKKISYEIGYKSSTGGELVCKENEWSDESVGSIEFYEERSELSKNSDAYVPGGILTLFCRIRIKELSMLSFHEREEQKGSAGVDKVLSDYKRLLLKGTESDACLVVGGKEFQAHKCILRARSPVFEAMFHHEMAEKESGRVVIDDLKPDRFQDFLEYLYAGRIDTFSDDNAFALYAAADKYDVSTLKSECVEYMSRSLSVDTICDVITLAIRHNEKDLMALALEYFKKNLISIILTVKWQRFLSENSTRANELLIKALVPGKESKQSTSTAECDSSKE